MIFITNKIYRSNIDINNIFLFNQKNNIFKLFYIHKNTTSFCIQILYICKL